MNKLSVLSTILGVGWYVAASLLIPFGIGFWLDRKIFHTFPILALVGLGIGTIIMIYGIYKMIRSIQINEKDKNEIKM